MNELNRTQFKTSLSDWATRLKGSSYLQRGWGLCSLCLLTGLFLFCSRLLGIYVPDSDPVRACGVILLINGIVLCVNWKLLKTTKVCLRTPRETLLWPGLFFTGSVFITLALLPAGASLAVLPGIGVLLLLGYFLVDMTLDAISSNDQLQDSTPLLNLDSSNNLPAANKTFEPEEHLTQWLSRKQDPGGTDTIEGMLRVELAAGQIQKAAHVAFTPSFSSIPELECEPLGDVPVEVIPGDVYPHGFRIEVRRSDSNREAIEVEVGFQAICASENQNAA